jgi:ABC-type phosphate transport system auxiliary subunit
MNPFFEQVVLVILGGSFAGAGGFWTYVRARKTRRVTAVIDNAKIELDSRRVESEAYANAQKINDDVVKGLHDELDHLRKDLKTEREGRAEDNRRHANEITELRAMIAQLQTELNVTRAQLRIPGITTQPEER